MTIGQSENRAGNPEKVAEKEVQSHYPLAACPGGVPGEGRRYAK